MNIKIKKTMVVNGRKYQCGDSINIKVQGEWYHGEIVALCSPVANMFKFLIDGGYMPWTLYFDEVESIRPGEKSLLNLVEFTKERLTEVATNVIWGLIEDDRESALKYFKDTCDMSVEELKYYGVDLTESEREEYER